MSKEKIIQEYINQIKDQIKTRQVSIDVVLFHIRNIKS